MKKQISSALLVTLACTQLSHAMQQAGRSARNKIRRVSMGPIGEEYSKATGAATLVRCTRQDGIEKCEEETWTPGLLPALLKLVKKPENPGLFHELQQEYNANQNGH